MISRIRGRFTAVAALLGAGMSLGSPADCADIAGAVVFAGGRPPAIRVGYCGVSARGEKLHCFAATTLGRVASSVTVSTYSPRLSQVMWDPAKGCTYSHSGLPAGRYLVYVRCGSRYVDYRLVTLRPSTGHVPVTLRYSATEQGNIVLRVRKAGGPFNVHLTPCGPKGADLLTGGDVPVHVGWDEEVQGGEAAVKGLKPGWYRVELRPKRPSGGQSSAPKSLGKWTVRAVAGKGTEYVLK
jgi:hypothetical protein